MPTSAARIESEQFEAIYDFARFTGKPQVYMIATTPRSGSHFLSHLLLATGSLGAPLEYFRPDAFRDWHAWVGSPVPDVVVREIVARRTSPTGWFGFKVHRDQFRFLNALGLPRSVLPVSRVLWIRRRDLLDQAISLVIAEQTEAWISFQDERREPVYDTRRILGIMGWLSKNDTEWRDYFRTANIEPRTVIYEDLMAEPRAGVDALLEWFGLPPTSAPVVPLIAKQATRRNRLWKQRFLDEIKQQRGRTFAVDAA